MSFFKNTIYWDKGVINSSAAGSIRVNRSNNGALGSYSTVDTLGPTGVATGSYIGSTSNDCFDAWYRLQVHNVNAGWSGSSDPMLGEQGLLCDLQSVKRRARLSANTDIADFDIYSAIKEITQEIESQYGGPYDRTYVTLDNSTGSTVYDFTGDKKPIYKVLELRVDGEPVPYQLGSWDVDTSKGYVKFNSQFITDNNGLNVEFDYIPKLFNELAMDMAALRVLEESTIIDGEDTTNPLISNLKGNVDRIKEQLRPKYMFGTSSYADYDIRQARFVYQHDWYDI